MPPRTERFEMRLDTSKLERVPFGRASLGSTSDTPQMDTKAQHKAAELASREIDHLGDRAATDEERAQRKRRLIKGPREFRELRGKSKR
jgi:hypothetical protein